MTVLFEYGKNGYALREKYRKYEKKKKIVKTKKKSGVRKEELSMGYYIESLLRFQLEKKETDRYYRSYRESMMLFSKEDALNLKFKKLILNFKGEFL